MSLSSSIVPYKLKIAILVLIYKIGSKDYFTNYRPISLLLGFLNIMDRPLFNRCISFLIDVQWKLGGTI